MHDFDLAVIGAGSAGLSVANVAARLGRRVALIERDRMGGDCLNTGCVPSKALLAASHAAASARAASRFGVTAPVTIDWPAIREHVRGTIAAIAPTDSQARYEGFGATVLRQTARFTGPRTLDVGGRALTASTIVVAAGSRAAMPDIPGLAETGYLTHETIFDVGRLPGHLLILGGGSIGIELAQAFAQLGSAVTLVERSAIGGRDDPELVGVLRTALTAAGVAIEEHATIARVDAGPRLVLADGRRIAGTHLLVAAGRTPNLEALDCAVAGLTVSPRGIATDRGLRASAHVYAVGDIADVAGIGPVYLTHAASHHAGIVIRRTLFRLPARVDALMPRVTYTDPELAQVGPTEAQAGAAARVLRWRLADTDRAVAERATEGLVKLVIVRGRLVGAGIAAPHAGEMISALTLAIRRRVPLSALADLIAPYPTRFEAARRAAGVDLTARLFAPRTRRLVAWLARLP